MDRPMRVLVACEKSGVVRSEFELLGHDAWSCDLRPSDDGGKHLEVDVLEVLDDQWDLMIAHPPCTDLTSSVAWLHAKKRENGRMAKSIAFFMRLANCDKIPLRCIENPIGVMSTEFRKPDQIIQPWQFGHPESKGTCLWLFGGLPKLEATCVLNLPKGCRWKNQTASGQNKLSPSQGRADIRSKTYQGPAKAMAEQWTRYWVELDWASFSKKLHPVRLLKNCGKP